MALANDTGGATAIVKPKPLPPVPALLPLPAHPVVGPAEPTDAAAPAASVMTPMQKYALGRADAGADAAAVPIAPDQVGVVAAGRLPNAIGPPDSPFRGGATTTPTPDAPVAPAAATTVAGGGDGAGALPAGVTQAMIDASLAANPNASKGGYEGVGTPAIPGPDGQTSYGMTLPQDGSQGTGPGPTPTGAAGGSPDLVTDPVYQQQKALDEQMLNDAASGYLSNAKDLLLGYGSSTLGKQVLDGLLADPRIAALFTPADEASFLASLSDNPDTSTSTLAQLKRKFATEEGALDEGYNTNNLFYGGQRAKALGDQNYSEQSRTDAVKTALMSALSKLSEGYKGAQDQAKQSDLGAYQSAYDRALQEALQNDTGAGTDTSSTTSTTTPTTPTVTAGSAPKAPKATKATAAKPAKFAPSTAAMALAARSAAMNAAYGLPKKKKVGAYAGKH